MNVRRAILIAALTAAAAVGWAQDARGLEVKVRELGGQYATPGTQYVVLIAIDKYRSWPALKNPVRDAREIKEILAQRYWVDRFLELYDEQATKAGINRLFGSLIEQARSEDSVFIFYAGHGYQDPMSGTGFWVPMDGGTDKYAQENWIPNAQIRGFVSRMQARHVALVSDSCFSGDILNPTRGRPEDITNEYFKAAYQRQSRQVLTSGASEAVPDSSEFAEQLKVALRGNRQPYLDPLMLYNEVRLGVRASTPLFGALKEAGHQEGGSFLLFLRETQAAAAPGVTVTVSKAYGSVQVEVKTAGDLYLDGVRQASLPAGASARLDNVETGARSLELRYADGQRESRTVTVEKDRAASASFSYVVAKPAAVPATIEMVLVEGGTFQMGDTFGDGDAAEKPVHSVTVSSFQIARYEVTVGQFRQFAQETAYRTTAEREGGGHVWTGSTWEQKSDASWRNPYFEQTDRQPVVLVSWFDAVEYCNWLSRKEGLAPFYSVSGTTVGMNWSANGYRLPTEAEWEYAARSKGKAYRYAWGNGAPDGNVADESAKKQFTSWTIWSGYTDGYVYTAPVGSYRANELGLYDMSGNVWEWCNDWYGSYSASSQTDPRGPDSGTGRVLRGGGWNDFAFYVRASNRYGLFGPGAGSNDFGFRPARRPG